MLFTIAAVAVMGATLFGSTYTQTQISGQAIDMSQMDINVMDEIRNMGGLQLVMPQAFAETDCGALAETGRKVVKFNLTGESVELPIMGGKTYNAMTFSGQVPGPTLRVTQGDVVQMTLSIPSDEVTGHGNDMHASQITALAFDSVNPGETSQYCYIAEAAGVFKYHCSGVHLIGMDQHVFSGMYGIAIVDPVDGYKKLMVEKTSVSNGKVSLDRQFYDADALEFQLQFNQLYLNADGNYDAGAMFKHQNSATVVNGIQFGYVPNMLHNILLKGDANKNIFVAQPWNGLELEHMQSQLLYVENDQHVRLFVENHGNEPVFFHIVGEILDRVTQGNRVQSAATETWSLGGSQNMIVDVVFDEPGAYALVNHDYAAIYTGGIGLFVAGDPFGLNPRLIDAGILTDAVPSYAYVLGNPSDAVPPMGKNSIAHPAVNIHGLYTDDVVSEMKDAGMIPLWEVIPTLPPVP
ncbi:MAG: multicopper oxidase domain-containing protein [Nitrosopumilus sp.]|nr:multicopper oxidase domain-containing protein [Nitrosopumilus sp.]MDF2423034.1 multicopper oxidase domain-containing protein [Nitrosopumilus sp.]MDF2424336.1 multicopper oxidase domain-containing protein [Nitrosopumilus sp.]MDF2424917.1 multicopper oxidase domain-containing protein [Nitrosopumilus sp.]MDF2428357.1 multicopper oxidase domain-containing protein [Nitrosopumilus sp.]